MTRPIKHRALDQKAAVALRRRIDTDHPHLRTLLHKIAAARKRSATGESGTYAIGHPQQNAEYSWVAAVGYSLR